MPCPAGVNIPYNFALLNEAAMYDEYDVQSGAYHNMDLQKRARSCVACGRCEALCPQQINIIEKLREVEDAFSTLRGYGID